MAKKKVQTNLFGEIEETVTERREEILPPLQIAKPKQKNYDAWVRVLSYNKPVVYLQQMSAPLVDLLRKYKVYYLDKEGTAVVPTCFKKMLAAGNKTKGTLAEFVALFLEPSNFMLYFNGLSPEIQELWRVTYLYGRLPASEANKIAGRQVLQKPSVWYGVERFLSSDLQGWFTVDVVNTGGTRYGTYKFEAMLTLEKTVTKHLIPSIFADVLSQEEQLDSLPEAEQLFTFCGEEQIFTELPNIKVLRESKTLVQNQNGRMQLSSLKAAARRMNLPEFFPAGSDASLTMLRAQMAINVIGYAVSPDRRKKQLQEEELVKEAVRKATTDNAFLLAVVLPELTGLRATMLVNSDVVEVVAAFYDALCDTDNKRWRTIDAMLLETMVSTSDYNFQLFTGYDYERATVMNKYNSKHVSYGLIREQITLPLLRGYAFLLAALGLVEIAYCAPKRGDASPYDGLRYVRVTDLGRYCAGRIKDYTPKSIAGKQFFEADEDQLLIKSLAAENPLLPIVTTIAEPITQRLYKVSYATFLRDCSSSNDIENRILQFKRYVCPTPSAVWRKFFADVRRRFKPFTTVSTKYSLAQIPADNKELQRILLTDPIIRKYTVKAEGYLLLIETAHQKQVAERLKTYGYLI